MESKEEWAQYFKSVRVERRRDFFKEDSIRETGGGGEGGGGERS